MQFRKSKRSRRMSDNLEKFAPFTHVRTQVDLRHLVHRGSCQMLRLVLPIILCFVYAQAIDRFIGTGCKPKQLHLAMKDLIHIPDEMERGWSWICLLIVAGVCLFLACVFCVLTRLQFFNVLQWYVILVYWFIITSTSCIVFRSFLLACDLFLDKVSFSVLLWNYSAVALICVFWNGPDYMEIAFQVINGGNISIVLTWIFPEELCWILLLIMTLWDIMIVIYPCWPIRMLMIVMRNLRGNLMTGILYAPLSDDEDNIDRRNMTKAGSSFLSKFSDHDRRSSTDIEFRRSSRSRVSQYSGRDSSETLSSQFLATLHEAGAFANVKRFGSIRLGSGIRDIRDLFFEIIKHESRTVKLGLGELVLFTSLVLQIGKHPLVILACVSTTSMGLIFTAIQLFFKKHLLISMPISFLACALMYYWVTIIAEPFIDECNEQMVFL